jgi:LysM repeat protein
MVLQSGPDPWPEVRMRPYRIVDETLDEDDDDEYPRVVSIGASSRVLSTPLGGTLGPQPWTPRDGTVPTPSRRGVASPVSVDPGFTRAHRWMIGSFLIVCVGMVLGMILVRVWDEASRTVAALPPEGSGASARQPAPIPAPPPPSAPVESAPRTAGVVTTEIRVLEPNYTVAPGDTLGIIARRRGTNVDALASINNLENRNSLSIGQKLIIP